MTNVAFPTIPTIRVTQKFGLNPQWYAPMPGHDGLDYGTAENTPIFACLDGVVSEVWNNKGGYGLHVRIRHESLGLTSIYGHANEVLVKVGQSVKAGQKIMLSGGRKGDSRAGKSTGPHLHFEVRVDGLEGNGFYGAVDPENYLITRFMPDYYADAVVVSDIGLFIRATADAKSMTFGELMRGETVKIAEVKGDWARLHGLRPAWVSAKWLKMTERTKPAELPAAPAETPSASFTEDVARRLGEIQAQLRKLDAELDKLIDIVEGGL